MTDKEIQKYVKEMKEFTKKIIKSNNGDSKKFLIETGIYSKKGNLRKPYTKSS